MGRSPQPDLEKVYTRFSFDTGSGLPEFSFTTAIISSIPSLISLT